MAQGAAEDGGSGRQGNVYDVHGNRGGSYVIAEVITTTVMARQRKLGKFSVEQQKCLQSLSFSKMTRRRAAIDPPMKNTCIWLLNLPSYKSWLGVHHGTLWLKGNPGTGKSTLIKKTLQDVEKRKDYITAAHFFNARGESTEKSYEGCLKSLLHQLLGILPTALDGFIALFRRKCELYGKDWEWEPEELEEVLVKIFASEELCPVALFIDALDECAELEVPKVVTLINNLRAQAQKNEKTLKICVSSRYYPSVSIPDCVEVQTEAHNEADIITYVHSKLPAEDDNLERRELQKIIIQKSSSVFLWVALVIELLIKAENDGESFFQIKTMVQRLPAKLYDLFKNILEDIGAEEKRRTCNIMQLVYASNRVLDVVEIYHAMTFSTGMPYPSVKSWDSQGDLIKSSDQLEKLVRSRSKGLLEVKAAKEFKSYVQFIHESVRDFLVDRGGFELLDPSLREHVYERSNGLWMRTCVNYLSLEEMTSMVPQGWTTENVVKISAIENTGKLPLADYSARNLLFHASAAESSALPEQQLLQLVRPLESRRWNSILFQLRISNVETANRYGSTFLHVACYFNLLNSIKEMSTEEQDFNIQNGPYHTPLIIAAAYGQTEVVKYLLTLKEVKADICCLEIPPITFAARKGHIEIVRLLLQRKDACVNTKHGRHSPLLGAVRRGDTEIVRLSLDWKGIDVNIGDEDGRTALYWARHRKDKRMEQMLVAKGAKKETVKITHYSMSEVAPVSMLKRLKMVLRGEPKQ